MIHLLQLEWGSREKSIVGVFGNGSAPVRSVLLDVARVPHLRVRAFKGAYRGPRIPKEGPSECVRPCAAHENPLRILGPCDVGDLPAERTVLVLERVLFLGGVPNPNVAFFVARAYVEPGRCEPYCGGVTSVLRVPVTRQTQRWSGNESRPP